MSTTRESTASDVEHVDEQQSRAVAEAAREPDWRKPSFAKGLYLGRFDLSLVHPHPRRRSRPTRARRGFLAALEALLRDGRRSRASSASRGSPTSTFAGARRARRVRHEDPARVRRPRARPVLLQPRAGDDRLGEPEPRRAVLGAPVDRRARAGQLFGTEEQKQRSSPAAPRARSPRSCSPSPTSAPTPPASARPPR